MKVLKKIYVLMKWSSLKNKKFNRRFSVATNFFRRNSALICGFFALLLAKNVIISKIQKKLICNFNDKERLKNYEKDKRISQRLDRTRLRKRRSASFLVKFSARCKYLFQRQSKIQIFCRKRTDSLSA